MISAPLAGSVANVRDGALQILLGLRRARHLHYADLKVTFQRAITPGKS